ncbi:MAG TPA: tetratricopeptide repeat protein [Caldithrix abyssi]|uniref:Tetratricopeptide repeat protein n=1 Tax=Caldithrix abyssi TaxID=187145 RepID=A0A7V1LJI2_CALAY|nr:tetratricopeptide repeat protein [Caldithrix abyssi]
MSKTRDKTELARDYFEKGFLLQQGGHLDRAAHFYRRSIEFHPTAQAYTFLGWVYSLKNLFEEAITFCKLAIELDEDYGNPYNDIGAYLIQLRRYEEAVPWLKKALACKSYKNYCYPHVNLGRVYEFKGQWDKAMREYRLALGENERYQPAQQAILQLQARYN